MEDEFRCTPTWRAKCWISGSGRPLRFEHWGVRGDFVSYLPAPLRHARIKAMKRTTQGTQGLYWFRPPLWCNTLLQCVVWWIASWADDGEQYKEGQPREGPFFGWCDELLGGVQPPFSLSLCY